MNRQQLARLSEAEQRRVVLAHHEGGHTALALALGLTVRAVTITRQGRFAGVCWTWRRNSYAARRRELIVLFGGGAAEERLTGQRPRYASGDARLARRLARELCGGDDRVGLGLMVLCAAEAESLLRRPAVWTAVATIAAALLQEKTLTGRRCGLLFRQATEPYGDPGKAAGASLALPQSVGLARRSTRQATRQRRR